MEVTLLTPRSASLCAKLCYIGLDFVTQLKHLQYRVVLLVATAPIASRTVLSLTYGALPAVYGAVPFRGEKTPILHF